MYDVIIIGAGPAGISAALYLQRANFKTLVLHNNMSNLQKTYQINNYYGFDSISGDELYKRGIDSVRNIGVIVKEEEVIDISFEQNYKIKTNLDSYESKYVILATGRQNKNPNIEGIKKYIGEGISYCAICDAFFYKDKIVAVIGKGLYAKHEKEILEHTCKKVYLLDNEEISNDIEKIEKKEKMIIFFKNGKTLEVDGIFVAFGFSDIDTLASKLGLITTDGFIKTDDHQKTNLKNFYVCGDLACGIKQITKASYDGMNAALDIISNKKEG